jgi:glycosyltransferase involved in cell wall biosynthesis
MTPRTGRLTIAMLTFRRPQELLSAVAEVLEQAAELHADPDGGYAVELLVVDNDPAGSGVALLASVTHPLLRAVLEPIPGIAAARNRALDEAAQADLLVFIDDDELPHPHWLRHLVRTYQRTGAAGVAGPVVSEFIGAPDPWIEAGGFFGRGHRLRLATGAQIDIAATNNLLLDLAVVRALDIRFDEGFGLSGGEDTLFTRDLTRRGAQLVWCREAVVTDQVPLSRMSRSWILKRVFNHGLTRSRVSLQLAGSALARRGVQLRSIGAGLTRIGYGSARFVLGVIRLSLADRALGLRAVAKGAGMISGAFGYVYHEYQRPDVPRGRRKTERAGSRSGRTG